MVRFEAIELFGIPYLCGIISGQLIYNSLDYSKTFFIICGICFVIVLLGLVFFIYSHLSPSIFVRPANCSDNSCFKKKFLNTINNPLLYTIILIFVTGIFCSLNYVFHEIITNSEAIRSEVSINFNKQIESIALSNPEHNELLKALLNGDKRGLSKSLINTFRQSGASHILALSGLHLGVIYLIIKRSLYIFNLLGRNRFVQILLSSLCIASCTFYTIMTGGSDSLKRALIFIIINEIAQLTNRKNNLRNVLWSSLVIQLSIFPNAVSSVSFQLSYAAIAGIAYLYPPLSSIYKKPIYTSPLKKIWDSVCLSISCQIGTGPLAWYYFHSFPQYFIITNLIAIPLVSIIIPFSILILVLHAAGYTPEYLLQFLDYLIVYLINSLSVISSMSPGDAQVFNLPSSL